MQEESEFIKKHLNRINVKLAASGVKRLFVECAPTDKGAMTFPNSNFAIKEIFLDESPLPDKEWISVEDAPLTEDMGNGRWICSDAGDNEFIAAVPYKDKKQPGKELWWIRHCVISNGSLCIVTDDDVEPCGWEIDSVTHYMPLPPPPSPIQNK